MKIRKAVITAAGDHHARLPLQTLVDRHGEIRTSLRLMLDEVADSGIEEVAIIVRPGQQSPYLAAAGPHASRLVFFEQSSPRGYGDAILRARDFAAGEAFLHLVSDHLYLSRTDRLCAQQLVEAVTKHECSVSAIQPTRENEVAFFGTIGGTPLPQSDNLYNVNTVIEKPTPTIAEQHLIVAGQRAGHYLCMFGMHVLTRSVMALLDQSVAESTMVQLSSTLAALARQERYWALETLGRRYDLGARFGLLTAQLALSLAGRDREEVLAGLVELLAQRNV